MGVFDMSVIENITMPKTELKKITENIENGIIKQDEVRKKMKRIKKLLTADSLDNYKIFLETKIESNKGSKGLINKNKEVQNLIILKKEVDQIKGEDLTVKRKRKMFL